MNEAKQEPVAQGEPCGWFDPQTGDYSRVNRIGWSEMYLHPAPVNTALLDALKYCKDYLTDHRTRNILSDEMAAEKISAAIAAAEKEMK